MATHFAFSPTFAFLGLVLCLHLLLVLGQLGPAPKKPADAEITPAQMAQLEEMQKNWTKLRRKMCDMKVPAADSSKLYNAMEACNKINHVYRIHQLLKPCHAIKFSVHSSNQTSYLDFERAECQFEECHMKILASTDYLEIMAELEKMTTEQRMSKAFERYKCISDALGVK